MFRRVRFRWTVRRAAHFLRSRPGRCVTVAIACLLVVWVIFRLLFVTSNSISNGQVDKEKLLASYTKERLENMRRGGQIPLCRAAHYPVSNASGTLPAPLPPCDSRTQEGVDPPIYFMPLLELAANRLNVNASHPLAKDLIDCRVRGIEWRSDNEAATTSDEVFKKSELGMMILHDFVLTECRVAVGKEKKTVHQVLVQASPKPKVQERVVRQLRSVGNHRRPDVLIVVIGDADVQRRRQLLPKTSAYLDSRGALDIPGLNGLSYDIKDNVIPLLTGRHLDELPNARRGTTSSQYVDIFNFLWYEYEKHAYATLLAEDTAFHTVFNKELHGFEQMPTDHYMRPFWMEMNRNPCIYGRHRHEYLFDYVRDFFFNYNNVTKLAVMVHHPGLEGNPESISALDGSLANLLTSLRVMEGEESNLALFLLGVPHLSTGGKDKSFSLSEVTRRLATAQIMLPDWFKVGYTQMWENFIRNTGQMTTFFDLNMFLRDLLKVGAAEPALGPNQDVHAHSLLRDMIRDKNCISAGVPLSWCTCVRKDPLDTSDRVANQAGYALLSKLNELTKTERTYCERLTKFQVLYVDIFIPKTKETVRVRGGPVHIREEKKISMHYFHIVIGISHTESEFAAVVELNQQLGTFNTLSQSIVRLKGTGDKNVENDGIRELCVSRI